VSGVLAIDTASPGGIALAFLESGEARSVFLAGTQEHSQRLLAEIDALVDGDRSRVAAIGVTTGPGSYAGLRVGIATAESLGMGLGVPVFGTNTFALAADDHAPERWVAVHPAGRGEMAFQRFEGGGPVGEPWIGAVAGDDHGREMRGEGAGALGGIEVTPERRAVRLARSTKARVAEGHPPQGLEAFYLREPNITRPKRTPLAPAGRARED
jgi:tRNA threonylcarbamoyl adenosine modification protein YeaZ